jgi:hypothetical protein
MLEEPVGDTEQVKRPGGRGCFFHKGTISQLIQARLYPFLDVHGV